MISKKINNNRDEAVEQKIKKVALEKLAANPDGFFIQDGDRSIRTINKADAINVIKEMPFDNAIMHFRMATVGKKNVENVHGWEAGGFQFLHNGMIRDYDYSPKTEIGFTTTKKETYVQEHSDSKLLFDALLLEVQKQGNSDKKIIKAIKKVINNCEFWGRAVLIDKAQDKAFLFGDWHVYLVENSYLLFSSADINVEQDYVIKTHGVTFEYSTKPLLESEFDGIAIIKRFSQPNFHWKYRTELEDATLDEREYTYTEQGTNYYGQDEDERQFAQEDKELEEKYNTHALTGRFNPLIESQDIEDEIAEIPEYQNMNPFDMNTITDETGTHDEYGICCENDTCWIYESEQYQQYQREMYQENNQQEIDFLNGLKKEGEIQPKEELLLEV